MSVPPNLEELRPRAFAVAYRMLGSVSEAEDIVQEALLRLHVVLQQGERIESPGAYLSTVVTRLCIDQLRSARVRRERYVGEWLPEQRAAFLLREVFDYPYEQIAAIIGTNEDNTRQLVARARKHVDERRPRFEASQERREQLARSFLAAVSNGDLHALEELLAHDVTLHGDGGGQVRAITRPIHGRAKVARALLSVVRAAEAFGGLSLRHVRVNGQPGATVSDAAGRLIAVEVLDIVDGHIQAVRAIANPDKLRHLDHATS